MVSHTENGLQVSVEEVAAWSRRLVITVPADRVRSERARVVRAMSKNAKIPGFRKGKIPPRHMEARFGEEIDRKTRTSLIQRAFTEAVQQTGLEPINDPSVTNVSYAPDSELTFEVAFDIWPEIQLDRVSGFRVQRPEVEVPDADVDEQLEGLRQRHAVWQPVERRPQAGDNVTVEITPIPVDSESGEAAEAEAGGGAAGAAEGTAAEGTAAGGTAAEGAAAEDPGAEESAEDAEARTHRLVLGQGQAIEDVEEAIMTLEPEAADDFTVTFPEDAADESRRGRSQRLRIRLREVLEPELPPLDDDLARQVGEFETLEELREAIRGELRERQEEEAEEGIERELLDQIIQANPFDVPDSWVDREVERYVGAILGEEHEGREEHAKRIRKEARPAAVWGIKRTLILRKIAEDEGLEAPRDELDERIRAIARRAERPESEVRAQLNRSGEMDRIRQRLTERKVLDFLKSKSEIGEGGD